ncbi:MAG TPA: porin [Pseudolabrys sp.]|nr:porin [Pseudolabrys sp.]
MTSPAPTCASRSAAGERRDNGSITWGWANANRNDRTTSNSTWRSRGYITADARNQTEYGTVRGYIAVGLNDNDTTGAPPGFSANRAFIQWAGFTFGLAQSFYDFYSVPATSCWGSFPSSDTGDGGWKVLGYTAQFGNGHLGDNCRRDASHDSNPAR